MPSVRPEVKGGRQARVEPPSTRWLDAPPAEVLRGASWDRSRPVVVIHLSRPLDASRDQEVFARPVPDLIAETGSPHLIALPVGPPHLTSIEVRQAAEAQVQRYSAMFEGSDEDALVVDWAWVDWTQSEEYEIIDGDNGEEPDIYSEFDVGVPELPREALDYLERVASDESADQRDQAFSLGQISIRQEQIASLQDEIVRLVHVARTHGASWAKIGAAAGITAQSAHQKWHDRVAAVERSKEESDS